MINSNTSFGKLNSVIVGRELELSKRQCDFTFQHFYQSNLNERIYETTDEFFINQEVIQERIKGLDDLEKKLTELGVQVQRPEKVTSVQRVQTPEFKAELSSASNVRDITLVLGNKIIETPTYVTHRYFENNNMQKIFKEAWNYGKGGQWIKSPNPILTKETIDLMHWQEPRDFQNFDKDKYTMAIDGAQFCRIGDDVIVNISTYNHYLGYLWVKNLYPEKEFHPIFQFVDNHLDGKLIALKYGTFLIDSEESKHKLLKQLPNKFRKWRFLIPTDYSKEFQGTENEIKLASSRGMDINILSIHENHLLVNTKSVGVQDVLEKNGFFIDTVDLKHSEVFAGGIHCSTLDLHRDD